MKCPNCGYIIQQGVVCPNCGVDAFIFKKTRNTSIRLYNKGLEQARVRDLTGAVKSLEQSILFDKNNYIARNLLGLVYHEKWRKKTMQCSFIIKPLLIYSKVVMI